MSKCARFSIDIIIIIAVIIPQYYTILLNVCHNESWLVANELFCQFTMPVKRNRFQMDSMLECFCSRNMKYRLIRISGTGEHWEVNLAQ